MVGPCSRTGKTMKRRRSIWRSAAGARRVVLALCAGSAALASGAANAQSQGPTLMQWLHGSTPPPATGQAATGQAAATPPPAAPAAPSPPDGRF
jgi:hypothetical protein